MKCQITKNRIKVVDIGDREVPPLLVVEEKVTPINDVKQKSRPTDGGNDASGQDTSVKSGQEGVGQC